VSLSAACSRPWVPTERSNSEAEWTAAPQKRARSSLLVQPQPTVKVLAKEQPCAFCRHETTRAAARICGRWRVSSLLGDQCESPNNLRFAMYRSAYSQHTLPSGKNRFRYASPGLAADHQSVDAPPSWASVTASAVIRLLCPAPRTGAFAPETMLLRLREVAQNETDGTRGYIRHQRGRKINRP
jgi:hypothetical protein